jgi:hypothetical protein
MWYENKSRYYTAIAEEDKPYVDVVRKRHEKMQQQL